MYRYPQRLGMDILLSTGTRGACIVIQRGRGGYLVMYTVQRRIYIYPQGPGADIKLSTGPGGGGEYIVIYRGQGRIYSYPQGPGADI